MADGGAAPAPSASPAIKISAPKRDGSDEEDDVTQTENPLRVAVRSQSVAAKRASLRRSLDGSEPASGRTARALTAAGALEEREGTETETDSEEDEKTMAALVPSSLDRRADSKQARSKRARSRAMTEMVEGGSGPKDDRLRVYYCVGIAGAGTLYVYFALLAAVDYFAGLFPTANIPFSIVAIYMYSNLFITFASGFIKLQPLTRALVAFALQLLVLIVLVAVEPPNPAFILAITAVSGVASFGQPAMFEYAGSFPKQYTNAIIVGQGLLGVVVASLRLITKAAYPTTTAGALLSARLFYVIGIGVLLLCVACTAALTRLDFAVHWQQYAADRRAALAGEAGKQAGVVDESLFEEARVGAARNNRLTLVRKLAKPLFTVFTSFVVTLTLFPGFTVSIPPTSADAGGWFAPTAVLLFNLGDFVGRGATRNKKWRFLSLNGLFWASILRIAFLPSFILSVKPLLIKSDAFAYTQILAMSATHGYLTGLALTLAPSAVRTAERGKANYYMQLALVSGLTIGASIGMVIGATYLSS
eukprot:PLAT4801.1.p1 GENE.PLAT4801.1~~PLAT4801.1.p1  ORF type:complete len:541 (+),score=216.91 PLAT4801.1:26-1624(+)